MNSLYKVYSTLPSIKPDKEVIKLAYITIQNGKSPIVEPKELMSYLKYILNDKSSEYDEMGAQLIYSLSRIYSTDIMEVIGGK